jgi:hypothetical protein
MFPPRSVMSVPAPTQPLRGSPSPVSTGGGLGRGLAPAIARPEAILAMPDSYDLVVLGGGPGGYAAAIRAVGP